MAKKAAKNEKREPMRIPRDPDVCFVLFPSAHLTSSSAAISLQSLQHQMQQHPAARRIKSIEYESQTRRLTIRFEPDTPPKED